jgi:hypothetical protein
VTWRWAGDSIAAVPSGRERRPDRVRVRYRRADGEFAETTLDRVVPAEVVAGLPVREFRWYKGRQHYSGWYWSATMNRHVVYESRLELARIMLADFDPAVAGLAAQPFQLTGPDGGRDRRHVPDLLLAGGDGTVTVVDVKAASRLGDPEVRAQFSWTSAVAASRGWGFEAWSGAARELLDNVRFLAGYRRGLVISAGLLPAVLEAAREQATIGSLSGRWPESTRFSWSARRCCTCCGRGGCGRICAGRSARPRRCGSPQGLRDERPGAVDRAGQPSELRRRGGRGGGGRRGAGNAPQRPHPPVQRRADFPAGGLGPPGGRDRSCR